MDEYITLGDYTIEHVDEDTVWIERGEDGAEGEFSKEELILIIEKFFSDNL